jgi:hypothetical protein
MFIAFFFIQVTQQKFYHFILLFEPLRTKIDQTTSHEKTLAPKKKEKKEETNKPIGKNTLLTDTFQDVSFIW